MSWRPQWPWVLQPRPRQEGKGGGGPVLFPYPDVFFYIFLVAAVFILVVYLVLPALILILQVLVFLAMLVLTVLLRVILRRPWIVEAESADGTERMQWAVVGWWRSRRVITDVAQGISLGHSHIQPEGARPLPAQ